MLKTITQAFSETDTFARVWAGLVLVCVVVTWPLWWPLAGGERFPEVPVVGWQIVLGWLPGLDSDGAVRVASWAAAIWTAAIWAARVSTAGWVVGLIAAMLCRGRRWPWSMVAITLGALFLLDQQRMQPWAYQTFLYAILWACVPIDQTASRRGVLAITLSIYWFSSLGKFDFLFAHTIGPLFIKQISSAGGNVLGTLDEQTLVGLSFALPIFEILIAAGLAFAWTRRAALFGAMGLHAGLLCLLGPWGLGQSPGVLVWNVALLIQAVHFELSMRHADQEKTRNERGEGLDPSLANASQRRGFQLPHPGTWRSVQRWVAGSVIIAALVAPVGERWGYWDHWLSWSLYSPHTSRAQIELHQSSLSKLPDWIVEHVQADHNGDRWRELSLQDWSLAVRRVPVYPQSRTQVALADQLAQRYGLGDGIRVIERGIADRFSGHRDERRLLGGREIQARRAEFWISRR